MRRIFTLLTLLLACGLAAAQSTEDVAVEITASVQTSPPRITLNWKRVSFVSWGAPFYRVYKKSKTALFWGAPIATLTTSDSSYVDNAVIVDSAYEYAVYAPNDSFTSTGYIYAGIKCPAIHDRGTILLIVDSTFIDSCSASITRLMNDLSGDGWQVIRHDFLRTTSDVTIKSVISNDYAAHPNVKAVLLLGHIAVPYSGDQNPDGHPDHLGAWPSDVYYASMTGFWSDVSVNDVSAGYVANRNTPGDGKWDQIAIPSGVQMQVSRIDFYDMPAFGTTEVQKMNSYLSKDHVYKMDSLNVIHRALIDDHFGFFYGEAFAANGFRNFPPLVGRDSMSSQPFISTLSSSSYQWAYGCGGGSFTSASGIGSTSSFTGPVNAIFTMLFGSYFGDWNVTNNFLRAPLCASTPALTSCWAGRPNWYFHHMALGDNIGYSAMITHNNTVSLYTAPSNYGTGWVHVALMGDLSLRTDYIKPVQNLTVATPFHNGAILNWTASPDPGVIGYYVYRADSQYGYFTRLTPTMITALTYHDLSASNGLKYYMVRPVKLQSTPSGGYYNLGVGITDTGTILSSTLQVLAGVSPEVSVNVFPNPALNDLNVTVTTTDAGQVTMYIVNQTGQSFAPVTKLLKAGENKYLLDATTFAPGIYTLVVRSGAEVVSKKWVKL